MKNCFKVIISIINTNEGRISGLEGSSIEITKVRKKKALKNIKWCNIHVNGILESENWERTLQKVILEEIMSENCPKLMNDIRELYFVEVPKQTNSTYPNTSYSNGKQK